MTLYSSMTLFLLTWIFLRAAMNEQWKVGFTAQGVG